MNVVRLCKNYAKFLISFMYIYVLKLITFYSNNKYSTDLRKIQTCLSKKYTSIIIQRMGENLASPRTFSK